MWQCHVDKHRDRLWLQRLYRNLLATEIKMFRAFFLLLPFEDNSPVERAFSMY